MNCPKCNVEIPESAKFCPECGTALSENDTPVVEPTKNTTNTTDVPTKKAKKKKSKKWIIIVSAIVILVGLVGFFVGYPLIAQATGDFSVIINMYHIMEYKVPNYITEINAGAFGSSDSLRSVIISDSVKFWQAQTKVFQLSLVDQVLVKPQLYAVFQKFSNNKIGEFYFVRQQAGRQNDLVKQAVQKQKQFIVHLK